MRDIVFYQLCHFYSVLSPTPIRDNEVNFTTSSQKSNCKVEVVYVLHREDVFSHIYVKLLFLSPIKIYLYIYKYISISNKIYQSNSRYQSNKAHHMCIYVQRISVETHKYSCSNDLFDRHSMPKTVGANIGKKALHFSVIMILTLKLKWLFF